jgi:serine/threonine protein kinase/tetratricopeptide (TPR) repeat protein
MSVLGDFELRREIGRGGMGTVFEAWQQSLQRTVAVKVLATHISSSSAAILRFQREAQAAARLHHTHIIPIFAQGQDKGAFYYAMELIEGRSLNVIIAETRGRQVADTATADPADTVALQLTVAPVEADAESTVVIQRRTSPPGISDSAVTLQSTSTVCTSDEHFTAIAEHIAAVADALDYAHQQGVIHRDIKPHNLILGKDGRMRISDFGLARVLEQPGVTMTGEMVGSPLYMPPEQILGRPGQVDPRTDIYSLGATMYEWLTLNPPYPGETREQVISKILTSEPLRLRAHNPRIPLDLETICLKSIERDRGRRYQSAAELRDDLRRFIERQPIRAKRTGVVTRTGKVILRHQVASVATVAAVIALLLGVAVVTKQSEVKTQTAAFEEAKAREDKILDLVSVLPFEIGGPLRVAEAAVPMIEGVVRKDAQAAGAQDTGAPAGASAAAAGTPAGIARRATRDFYEAVAPPDQPPPPTGESDQVAVLLGQAKDLWNTDPNAGLAIATACLAARADDYEALQLETALHGRLGRYDKMLEDARGLLRIRPQEVSAQVWQALAHVLLGEGELALSALSQIQESGNPHSWIPALRGLALAGLERAVEAASVFDDALEADPDLIVALLGRACAKASLGNLVGAVTDLSRVIKLEPANADALAVRGDYYLGLEDYEAAEQDYEQAMNIAGRTPAIVMRYLFAVSQQRNVLKRRAGQPDSAGGREIEAGSLQAPTGSARGSALDWVPRQPDRRLAGGSIAVPLSVSPGLGRTRQRD